MNNSSILFIFNIVIVTIFFSSVSKAEERLKSSIIVSVVIPDTNLEWEENINTDVKDKTENNELVLRVEREGKSNIVAIFPYDQTFRYGFYINKNRRMLEIHILGDKKKIISLINISDYMKIDSP